LRPALLACCILALSGGAALAGPAEVPVKKLPAPPWQRFGPGGTNAHTRLTLLSTQPNQITDTRAWFARNHLDFGADQVPGPVGTDTPLHPLPAGTPTSFRGNRLVAAVRRPGRLLLVYGKTFDAGRYLVARSHGRSLYALDFGSYANAPKAAPGERSLVYQAVTWAADPGGTLLVSNAHSTYARSSKGLNAYITSIDPASGKVRWRSRPLVANAQNFAVVKDVVVAGYGFTKEPDFLYVLDRATGAVAQRFALPSSPEYIVAKGNRVFVRTYDHDLVFGIRSA
jgi:outer membrane protein assembly factor BamB